MFPSADDLPTEQGIARIMLDRLQAARRKGEVPNEVWDYWVNLAK